MVHTDAPDDGVEPVFDEDLSAGGEQAVITVSVAQGQGGNPGASGGCPGTAVADSLSGGDGFKEGDFTFQPEEGLPGAEGMFAEEGIPGKEGAVTAGRVAVKKNAGAHHVEEGFIPVIENPGGAGGMGTGDGDIPGFECFKHLLKAADLLEGEGDLIKSIGGGQMGADAVQPEFRGAVNFLGQGECFFGRTAEASHAGVYLEVNGEGLLLLFSPGPADEFVQKEPAGDEGAELVFKVEGDFLRGSGAEDKKGFSDASFSEERSFFCQGNAEAVNAPFVGGESDGEKSVPVGIGLNAETDFRFSAGSPGGSGLAGEEVFRRFFFPGFFR